MCGTSMCKKQFDFVHLLSGISEMYVIASVIDIHKHLIILLR